MITRVYGIIAQYLVPGQVLWKHKMSAQNNRCVMAGVNLCKIRDNIETFNASLPARLNY